MNHKTQKTLLGCALTIVLFAVGCGESYDPNLGQKATPAEVESATSRRDETVSIYKRADGKWENMTPADRTRLLELSNGDEGMAKQGWPHLGALAK